MTTINAIGTPTITLGGTFTMSGAYSFTGTLTNNTSVTFPTSGTLATVSELITWAANSSSSISAAVNNGYILTSGSATTVTLPTTFAVGSLIGVGGEGAAWTIDIGASTNVKMFGNTYTTSIASSNTTDSIVLLATVANTTWIPIQMLSTGFTVS